MIVRMVLFVAVVAGIAGATAAMGVTIPEEASACQAYKAC